MKRNQLLAVLCALALTAEAQKSTVTPDSIAGDSVHAMKEVVVEASHVSTKSDRELYMPTSLHRKMSSNGLDLLHAMQLPRIDVDLVNNSVKTSGNEAVQLRINGVEATVNELLALQPKDIIRMEYHTMPGVRYGNSAAVIDYIVRHRETGGDISANGLQGITLPGMGNYNVAGKLYMGKSSLSLMGNWDRRNLTWTRENEEQFALPGGTVTTRETGRPTKVKYDRTLLHLNYSYTSDKSLLSIAFRMNNNCQPSHFEDRDSRMYVGSQTFDVTDRQSNRQFTPSLDAYYQLNISKDKHLYLDVVGTYIKSRNERTYTSTPVGTEDMASGISSVSSFTDGKKYSVIAEAIYEKTYEKGKFTAGVKHTQAYTHNKYSYPDTEEAQQEATHVSLHTSETYAFAEFQHQLGSFGYVLGMGLMNTYNEQGQQSQDKIIVRPSATLTWQPAKNLFLRYNGYVSAYSPSLASLSNVEQAIDNYQLRRGNPRLKATTFVANSLSLSWRTQPVTIDLYARYSYDHKPVMEETLIENNMIVRTEANQRGFHRLNIETCLRLRPFCKMEGELAKSFTLNVIPFFNRYISNGNSYVHTHSNWGLRLSAMAMWKHWLASAEVKTSRHELWGETLKYEEATHMLSIGHRRERWSVNLVILNPFTKRYEQRQEKLSRQATSLQSAFSNDFRGKLMLNFSYNISFGKLHRNDNRHINNSDTDAGLLSGQK